MRNLTDRYGRIFNETSPNTFEGHGIKIKKAGSDQEIISSIEAMLGPDCEIENPVPQSVTPRQLHLALIEYELYDEVTAMVDSSTDIRVKAAWHYAIAYERSDPMINGAARLLGLNDDAMDDLFRIAAVL